MILKGTQDVEESFFSISSNRYFAIFSEVGFNEVKGYGFITMDDGKEVFVHYTGIKGDGFRTLSEGDAVEFEVTEGPKGLQAVNVQRANRQ